MQILRSYWYYWHTGNKLIAIISMILTTAALWLGLVIAAGLSIWGVILAVLLDTVGFWVVVIYAVALRNYLPSVLVEQGDTLIQQQFLLPVLTAFLVGRIITFYVAKFFHTNHNPWVKKAATATMAALVLLAAGGLGFYQYQQNAAAEAARLEAEANAITVEKLKTQAAETADSAAQAVSTAADDAAKAASTAAESTSKATAEAVDDAKKALDQASTAASKTADQVAVDAKQKLLEACKRTAEALGKSPDDYCK
jgi:glucan phosphoethanolaminetransferase (alkaline phosphatase superfamily)